MFSEQPSQCRFRIVVVLCVCKSSDLIEQFVLDGNGLVERGFVNAGRARQLLAAHREGRAEHSFHLWVLLNALLWYRRFCGA